MLVDPATTIQEAKVFGSFLTIIIKSGRPWKAKPARNILLEMMQAGHKPQYLEYKSKAGGENHLKAYNHLIDVLKEEKAGFTPQQKKAGSRFLELLWNTLWKVGSCV